MPLQRSGCADFASLKAILSLIYNVQIFYNFTSISTRTIFALIKVAAFGFNYLKNLISSERKSTLKGFYANERIVMENLYEKPAGITSFIITLFDLSFKTTCFFYKHSVFQSEARICLSFSQIQPQNMLKICLSKKYNNFNFFFEIHTTLQLILNTSSKSKTFLKSKINVDTCHLFISNVILMIFHYFTMDIILHP